MPGTREIFEARVGEEKIIDFPNIKDGKLPNTLKEKLTKKFGQ
jgi:hypothetical protein